VKGKVHTNDSIWKTQNGNVDCGKFLIYSFYGHKKEKREKLLVHLPAL
jgi:hypothetical protein